jgi:hypothetical protein
VKDEQVHNLSAALDIIRAPTKNLTTHAAEPALSPKDPRYESVLRENAFRQLMSAKSIVAK